MRVSFYGSLAELIAREINFTLPRGATVGDVRDQLAVQHPAAAGALSGRGVRAFVDDVVATDDAVLSDAVELAFLPPLSGG